MKEIVGKHTIYNYTSENVRLLGQLAVEEMLTFVNTHLETKCFVKGEWRIPGTDCKNKIDHDLVTKRHTSSVKDVKSARGSNCDSDHFVLG